MARRSTLWIQALVLVLAALPAAAQPTGARDALSDVPAPGALTVRGSFYVPAYTRFALARGNYHIDFSVTLAVHNTSSDKPLVVQRIAYYDTAGTLVRDHLAAPVAIRPFGTLEIAVPSSDARGGTGANFVVDWAAAGPMAEPVMETLILGTMGTQGFSFVGQGRPIRIVGDRP